MKRDKQTRKKLHLCWVTKKASSCKGQNSALEMCLTSVDELWEILTTEDRVVHTQLDAEDVIELFVQCQRIGLNSAVARTVPMHICTSEPQDISLNELAHLCKAVLDDPTISENTARVKLFHVRTECAHLTRLKDDIKHDLSHRAVGLRLQQFRKMIQIVAALLQVDLQYVVSQLVWMRTRRFEMTDTLAATVIERCVRLKGANPRKALSHESSVQSIQSCPSVQSIQSCPDLATDEEVDPTEKMWALLNDGTSSQPIAPARDPQQLPDYKVLEQSFTMNDFVLLAYHAGITETTSKTGKAGGISYPGLSDVFTDTLSHLQARVDAHSQKRDDAGLLHPRSAISVRAKDDWRNRGLIGRTEFQVLMEQLFKAERMSSMFSSPLEMVVSMLQRSSEQEL